MHQSWAEGQLKAYYPGEIPVSLTSSTQLNPMRRFSIFYLHTELDENEKHQFGVETTTLSNPIVTSRQERRLDSERPRRAAD